MVDDFVDEPNVPNNAIGGCGCLSFLVVIKIVCAGYVHIRYLLARQKG